MSFARMPTKAQIKSLALVKTLAAASVAALAAFTLSACELNLRKSIGLVGNGPDEFRVISNDRLKMPEQLPTDPSGLPEPQPGARSLVEPRPLDDAKAALNVDLTGSADPSESEAALVASIGAGDAGIRAELEAEASSSSDDPRVLQPLLDELFGNNQEQRDLLDPVEESHRLALEAQRGKNPDLEIPPPPEE